MTFIFLVAAFQILSSFAYSALTTAASAIYFNKLDLENAHFLGYHHHSVSCHYM